MILQVSGRSYCFVRALWVYTVLWALWVHESLGRLWGASWFWFFIYKVIIRIYIGALMSRTGFWSRVCRFELHEQSLLPPGMRLRCVLGNCPAGILLPMAEPLCSFTTAGSCADSFCLPHCAEIRNHFGGKQFLSGTHPMIGRSYVCVCIYIYIYTYTYTTRST